MELWLYKVSRSIRNLILGLELVPRFFFVFFSDFRAIFCYPWAPGTANACREVATWQCSDLSASILDPEFDFFSLPDASRRFWMLLDASGCFWMLLGAFEVFWTRRKKKRRKKLVFGILGDQYGGIIVWAYTFQKTSGVNIRIEKKIQCFCHRKSEKNLISKKRPANEPYN